MYALKIRHRIVRFPQLSSTLHPKGPLDARRTSGVGYARFREYLPRLTVHIDSPAALNKYTAAGSFKSVVNRSKI
jgi:hypothetical protein